MWYMIVGEDYADSLDKRLAARAAHLERLTVLQDEQRVLLAGPNPAIDAVAPGAAGFTGSLLVVEFPSLAEAQSWADDDPYVHAGVYEHVTVKPFNPVLPRDLTSLPTKPD